MHVNIPVKYKSNRLKLKKNYLEKTESLREKNRVHHKLSKNKFHEPGTKVPPLEPIYGSQVTLFPVCQANTEIEKIGYINKNCMKHTSLGK